MQEFQLLRKKLSSFKYLVSYNTADAGVKIGKNPQTIQKKKNRTYSCEELSKKRRNSSNIVVKVKQRRPKWR